MVVEPLKKLAIGDMPPSPTTSNPISSNSNTHKKSTRHHYKRRSSGRVHVTKPTPMAKAQTQQQLAIENGNECNNDDDVDKDGPFEDVNQQPQRHQQLASRKPMKRSQSNKSIHRLSSIDPQRKVNLSGFVMTSKAATSSSSQNALHVSPPMTPTDQQQFQQTQPDPSTKESVYAPNRYHIESAVTALPTEKSTRKPQFTRSPSFHVSHQAAAAPIANTLHATANALVAPDRPALANLTTSAHISLSSLATTSITITARSHDDNNNKTVSKKKHLCSRFVRQDTSHLQHFPTTTTSNDIFSADHTIPNFMNLFTFGDLEKEYQYIQTYQDPMMQSLTRCMKQRQQQQQQHRRKLTTRPTQQSTQSQLQRLTQRGIQQRTLSSSILPTISTLTSLSSSSSSSPAAAELILRPSPSYDSKQQYPEHCTLARQRYRRLQAVYASSSSSSSSSTQYHHSSAITTSEIKRQPPSRWSASTLLGRVFSGTP